MSSKNVNKYLWDIADSITQIESHISAISDLDAFASDQLVRDAVERRLIIIGEAIRRLRQMGIDLLHADSIINRRNTIIHQYDDFSVRAIWRHIQDDLPDLKAEVTDRLKA